MIYIKEPVCKKVGDLWLFNDGDPATRKLFIWTGDCWVWLGRNEFAEAK